MEEAGVVEVLMRLEVRGCSLIVYFVWVLTRAELGEGLEIDFYILVFLPFE